MLDKSTASRVVETLDRKGYVKRTVHPSDARAVQLSASARGRSLHETIQRELLDEERAVIESLPADVRRATVGVVRELAKVAAQRIGRVAPCCGDDACET
jgi:DNA-binding MarR family transcriptional regulator